MMARTGKLTTCSLVFQLAAHWHYRCELPTLPRNLQIRSHWLPDREREDVGAERSRRLRTTGDLIERSHCSRVTELKRRPSSRWKLALASHRFGGNWRRASASGRHQRAGAEINSGPDLRSHA